jgi:hypothetical protein
VQLVRDADAAINFELLLKHISQWQHEDRWVQKRWAQDFYRITAQEQNSQGTTTTATSIHPTTDPTQEEDQ